MAVIEGRERHIVGGVDTHKDLHVAAVVDEQDRILVNTILPHDPAALVARCSPGCSPSVSFQRIGIESTGSYGAGLLRFMGQAKVVVLEVTTPTSRIDGGEERTTISTPRTAAHAALAGQRTVTPRSFDGMIESLRIPMACRKTAVSAKAHRPADDP